MAHPHSSSNASHGHHRQRVEVMLDRIERFDQRLNAMMEVTADGARAAADAADQADREGRSTGPLHGVVIALKDNIDTAGIRTTSGSKLFEEYVPSTDATVWRSLKEAGAILIGKAGLHECVFGPTSQNIWYGRIRNPWNPNHIPGGSSGGSGAAVAAGYCDVALGTDTGGSVRIPSSMCGISGIRGTMGVVPNTDVRPISPHLDTIGPMAWNVSMVARVFAVMQRFDARDDTSRAAPWAIDLNRLGEGVRGLRIGRPGGFFAQGLHPAVQAGMDRACQVFADLGAEVVDVDLPEAERASTVCPRIIVADAADYYHDELQHRSDALGDEVTRRMKLGFEVTGIEYANHMRFMYRWQRQLALQFQEVDCMISPTIAIPAPSCEESDDLLKLVGSITPFTMAWAIGAVPTMALPSGFSDEGLPVSIQLAGPKFSENLLFRAGHAFQQATDFHTRRPRLA